MTRLRIERIDEVPAEFERVARELVARSNRRTIPRNVRALVDRDQNPWFRHGEAALYAAYRGREALGRICAHVDFRWFGQDAERVGRIGLFEAARTPEVAARLFRRAESWLREQGCTRVVGPIDPRGVLSGGILTAGFDRDLMIDTPHTPPYYPEIFEDNGFENLATLLSWKYSLDRLPVAVRQISRAVSLQPGLELEPVDLDRFEYDLDRITDVYNQAWRENWGFVPIDREEMREFLSDGRRVDPSISFIASVDGESAAIAIACPNYLEWGSRLDPTRSTAEWVAGRARCRLDPVTSFRQMLFGIVPKFRGRAIGGLGIHMYARVLAAARASGYQSGESMWTLSIQDVLNGGLALMGAEKTRDYCVYQKDL